MTTVALILLLLAGVVAVLNIYGVVVAIWRRAHGDLRNYSCIPFFSIALSVVAFLIARQSIGLWAFFPVVIDPGAWVTATLPFVLFREMRQNP